MLQTQVSRIGIFILGCQLFFLACNAPTEATFELTGPVNNRVVKELDALQTSAGTLLLASMERSRNYLPENEVSIYRSTDEGISWDTILTFQDSSMQIRQYADPRLVEDRANGRIYLVLMLVRFSNDGRNNNRYRRDYYLGDIAVFRSDDDGRSWQYQSSPHVDPIGAYGDLPFPAIDGDGCLWVFHSRIDTRRLIAPSGISVHRSCDGGQSWEQSYEFPDTTIAQSRKNLGSLIVKNENTLAGTFTDQHRLYYFELTFHPDIHLSYLQAIPMTFGESKIPIAYLYHRKGTGQIGILSYLPHQYNSPIRYAHSTDGGRSWSKQQISNRGAYPNILIRENGQMLVTFNRLHNGNFQLIARSSKNGGEDFDGPAVLYERPFETTENGEYQALITDDDGNINLFFCDWSDRSRAKLGRIVME